MSESLVTAPATREFVVDLQMRTCGKPLITWLIATIIVMFAVTSLERISGSPAVHAFDQSLWLSLRGDGSFFQGQIWRVVTSLCLHGGLYHVGTNLIALSVFWWSASQYYNTRAWFGTYLLAGIIANIITLAFLWHNEWGSVSGSGVFGASGSIFGLCGMMLVAGVRLHMMRGKHPVAYIKPGPGMFLVMRYLFTGLVLFFYIPLFAIQIWHDHAVPIAGLLHFVGLVVGVAAGMILPMKVGTFVFASRHGLVNTKSTFNHFKGLTELQMSLDPSFNSQTDGLLVVEYFVDYRWRWHVSDQTVLVGNASISDKSVLIASSGAIP